MPYFGPPLDSQLACAIQCCNKKNVATNASLLQNIAMGLDDQIRIRCDTEWKEAVEEAAEGQGKTTAYFIREAVTIMARRWYRSRKSPVIPPALYNPHINGEGEE